MEYDGWVGWLLEGMEGVFWISNMICAPVFWEVAISWEIAISRIHVMYIQDMQFFFLNVLSTPSRTQTVPCFKNWSFRN